MTNLKLKRGEKAFSIQLGECTVVSVRSSDNYPILVRDYSGVYSEQYNMTGRQLKSDVHPSLFESAESCKEYFNNLTDDVDDVEISFPIISPDWGKVLMPNNDLSKCEGVDNGNT